MKEQREEPNPVTLSNELNSAAHTSIRHARGFGGAHKTNKISASVTPTKQKVKNKDDIIT